MRINVFDGKNILLIIFGIMFLCLSCSTGKDDVKKEVLTNEDIVKPLSANVVLTDRIEDENSSNDRLGTIQDSSSSETLVKQDSPSPQTPVKQHSSSPEIPVKQETNFATAGDNILADLKSEIDYSTELNLTALKGKTRWRPLNDISWNNVIGEVKIPLDSEIQTFISSESVVTFNDASRIKIMANSQITIKQYELGNQSSEYLQTFLEIDVKDGYLLFDIVASNNSIYQWQFGSRFGSLGIHGTKGEFRVRDQINAAIFEGSGTFTQISVKGSDSLPKLNIAKLNAGSQFTGKIEKPRNISNELESAVRIFTLNAPKLIDEFVAGKLISDIDRNGLLTVKLENPVSHYDPIDISDIASIGTLIAESENINEEEFA